MAVLLSISEAWLQVAVIATAILIAALIIARATAQQTNVLSRIAGENIFDGVQHRRLDEETWRAMVEQIAADMLHRTVNVASFTALWVGRTVRIRFALRDGRMLEFTTARSFFPFKRVLDPKHSPRQCAEMHAICRYFAQTHQGGAVSRHARWRVKVLKATPARQSHPSTTSLQQSHT